MTRLSVLLGIVLGLVLGMGFIVLIIVSTGGLYHV